MKISITLTAAITLFQIIQGDFYENKSYFHSVSFSY